ncbi:metalloprotease [Dipsacomyces acuminosporus]|nr:metalloprotease [Dipsacomyces acuminosporus]
MGSEKYPKESQYHSFITQNSGSTNAFTSLEKTSYYFTIANDAFEEALDIFAQFFTNPLFNPGSVDREVHAIDSEHKCFKNHPGPRQYRIVTSTLNSKHPISRFNVGNRDTLKLAAERLGVDLREEVVRFYNRYYSADIMKLVVVSNSSLDQMTEWVVAKFSGIASKGITKPLFLGRTPHMLSEAELGTIVRYRSMADKFTITMCFEVPDTRYTYLVDPVSYFSSLVKEKGPGSLCSFLLNRGWATDISSRLLLEMADGFNILKIQISATSEGFCHYEDIVCAVFAYIKMLQLHGPQEWYYKEIQQICDARFRYAELGSVRDLAANMANGMHNAYLLPEHTISRNKLYRNYDKNMLAAFLSIFNANNLRLYLGSKDIDGECTHTERYYRIEYRVDTFSGNMLGRLNGENLQLGGFHLPEQNQYLPQLIDARHSPAAVAPKALSTKEPVLLKLTDGIELWFKKDDQFFLPHGCIYLFIENSAIYESPLTNVMTKIYTVGLQNKISETTYGASKAGMSFELNTIDSGILIEVKGFSDKLRLFLNTIVQLAKSFTVDKVKFQVYVNEVRQTHLNYKYSVPRNLVDSDTPSLTLNPYWTMDERLEEMANVNIQSFQHFVDHLFDAARIKMIMVGDFKQEDALESISHIQKILNFCPLPDYTRLIKRAHQFHPGSYIHQLPAPDKDNINSAVSYAIYTGAACNLRERAIISLIGTLITTPFFDQIRTKEQLGYIVSGKRCILDVSANHTIQFLIQSEANPCYLILRIDEFLRSFRAILVNMSDREFNGLVATKIQLNQEKPKNITDEARDYLIHIFSEVYEFDQKLVDSKLLGSITKRDLVDFWDRYISVETAPKFTRLISTMWSGKIPKPTDPELAAFPETCIALFGCLYHVGATEFSLEYVASFVTRIADGFEDGEGAETLVASSMELLKQEYKEAAQDAAERGQSGKTADDIDKVAGELASESTPASSQVRTALVMAIKAAQACKPIEATTNNHYASTGMIRTYDGSWLIKDRIAFKNRQELLGIPIRTRKLVPKYSK